MKETGKLRRGVVAAVVAAFLIAGTATADTGPDREASYVGASATGHGLNDDWIPLCELVFGKGDCPTTIPSAVISTTCDDDRFLGLGFQGVGGVVFCQIPRGSTVFISIDDDNLEMVTARVWCMMPDYWFHLGDIDGSGAVHVPASICFELIEGGTRLAVVNILPPVGAGATTGTTSLTFM